MRLSRVLFPLTVSVILTSSLAFALSPAKDDDELDVAPLRVSFASALALKGGGEQDQPAQITYVQDGTPFRSKSDPGFKESEPYCEVEFDTSKGGSPDREIPAGGSVDLKGEFVEGSCSAQGPGACHNVFRFQALGPAADGKVRSMLCSVHEGVVGDLKGVFSKNAIQVTRLESPDSRARNSLSPYNPLDIEKDSSWESVSHELGRLNSKLGDLTAPSNLGKLAPANRDSKPLGVPAVGGGSGTKADSSSEDGRK